MIFQNTKLLIGIFVLLLYVSVGTFGLIQFSHISETPMIDCPYTQNNSSLCENSLSHINDWRQFSSVIPSPLFIFLLFISGIVLYFLSKQNFLKQKQYFCRQEYYLENKKSFTWSENLIGWLSLFINSPSFIFRA